MEITALGEIPLKTLIADKSKILRERRAHKVMTPEEYAALPIIGWHEVCRDVDGFGGTGIRYLGERQ